MFWFLSSALILKCVEADDGDLDFYIIVGPNVRDVIRRFCALTGVCPIPPKWSLGYLGSTMSYTDAPNAQEQLALFPKLCSKHGIPCSMFHLSSGYTLGMDGHRYVFTWNTSAIPNPKQMIEVFHEHNIKVCPNIKPCILTTHPCYDELADSGAFIKNSDGRVRTDPWWGGLGSSLDFTSPHAYDWWKEQIKAKLLHLGIDAIWNDNNEFAIFDDDAVGLLFRVGMGRCIHTLLMAKASYEAMVEFGISDPFLISRCACPGVQRFAQTWTGDNFTSWKTLKYNAPMGMNLSLSGMFNYGHDVGGFAGPRPEEQLWIRWIQDGIFHPRFTIHSWNSDGTVNEPWMYPNALPIVQRWIRFRYALQPYLMHLFCCAHALSEPLVRPLFYDFPDDVNSYDQNFEWMLGSAMLIAPVHEKDATAREVYLPSSAAWWHWSSHTWYPGGNFVEVPVPLEEANFFLRDLSIIPLSNQHSEYTEFDSETLVCLVVVQGGEHGRKHNTTSFSWDILDRVAMDAWATALSIKVCISKEEVTVSYSSALDLQVAFVLVGCQRTLQVKRGQLSTSSHMEKRGAECLRDNFDVGL